MNYEQLREEVIRLAPWHLNVEITPELSTGLFRESALSAEQAKYDITFIDQAREWWMNLIRSIYPDGLDGRTVLDCACNCGGYSFWMKEMGGGGGLAFDVRQQWINQARFLQEHRLEPSDGLRFEVSDLYEFPNLSSDDFDISIFKGIFYHLPDPIHGLKMVADRTRELLIVNTAARNDFDDGMLVASRESVEHPMSGVHGLNWFPTGPDVVSEMLASMGFATSRCSFWRKDESAASNLGRLEVLAARDPSVFEHYDEVRRLRAEQMEAIEQRRREREAGKAGVAQPATQQDRVQ